MQAEKKKSTQKSAQRGLSAQTGTRAGIADNGPGQWENGYVTGFTHGAGSCQK